MGETMQPGFLEGLRSRFNELVGRPAEQPAASPVVTSGAAQVAPRLPQTPAEEQPSLLDQLRQRVQRDIAPGPMSNSDRFAAFGRGVLSNRGSFLDNLTAGLASQGQAESARREEARKAAELESNITDRDRRAMLDKAKFAEETTPGSLTARLREAQINAANAQAGAASQANLQIVGTDAQGNAIAMNPRTGETRTLTGVRPTRSELAEMSSERAYIQAATTAARAAVDNAVRSGQVRSDDQAGQNRIYQETFDRALMQARQAAGRGGQGSPGAAGTPAQAPSQRFQYQPPQ
jgi:hypothetical protein